MVIINFDGSYNKDKNMVGWSFYSEHFDERGQLKIEDGSNNVAEYIALIKAMEYCTSEKIKHVTFIGDSKMVIDQMNNEKIGSGKYKSYAMWAFKLRMKLPEAKFKHVLRNENKEADKLSKIRYK